MQHNWKEFKKDGTWEDKNGICFHEYRHSLNFKSIIKIHFFIPLSGYNKIPEEVRGFFLDFLSGILNKEAYKVLEGNGNAIFEIDCKKLGFNKNLIFSYLVFFRYLLEFPQSVYIFHRENKEIKDPEILLINFIKQVTTDDYYKSGVTNPNHCIVGRDWQKKKVRPVKEILADLADPIVLKTNGCDYFLLRE